MPAAKKMFQKKDGNDKTHNRNDEARMTIHGLGQAHHDMMWHVSEYLDEVDVINNLRGVNKEFRNNIVYQVKYMVCGVRLQHIPDNIRIVNLVVVIESIKELKELNRMYNDGRLKALITCGGSLEVKCYHMNLQNANHYAIFFKRNMSLSRHVSVLDLTCMNNKNEGTWTSMVDLAPFTRLRSLNMDKCMLSTTLLNLPITGGVCKIKHLSAQENQLHSITKMCNKFELMQMLNLSYNQIRDISCLENSTNLITLELDNNLIEDVTVLKKLQHLKKLRLRQNQLEDCESIECLTELTYLALSSNFLTDTDFLHTLVNLKYLEVSDNSIWSIKGVRGCKSLEIFHGECNEIEDITWLACNCNELKTIDLRDNDIAGNASYLNNLKNLKRLDVSENSITKLILPDLYLEHVDISFNPMSIYDFISGGVINLNISTDIEL